jgi:hypothetical protein
MRKRSAAPRCSNGVNCVAYATLGEPVKLSRGNPGPLCFACEERRAASEVEKLAGESRGEHSAQARGSHKAKRSGRNGGNRPKVHLCMKPSCERPVAEHNGMAVVCREHAEESRAAAVQERRRAWVLTCERAVRAAIDSGDKALERKWARLLLAAEVSFAESEAELQRAEIRARPGTPTQPAERIPKTG